MIAERFHDDFERSWAMGFAMGGLALGILGELIGFTFICDVKKLEVRMGPLQQVRF